MTFIRALLVGVLGAICGMIEGWFLFGLGGIAIGGLVIGLKGALVGGLFGGHLSSFPQGSRGTTQLVSNAAIGFVVLGLLFAVVMQTLLHSLVSLIFTIDGAFLISLQFINQHPVVGALDGAWVGGLAGVLLGSPSLQTRHIVVVERLGWSYIKALRALMGGLLFGLLFGMLVGLLISLSSAFLGPLTDGTIGALSIGLCGGLVFGGVVGLVGGLEANELEARTITNQGIWRSARSAIIGGVLFGIIVGVFGTLLISLFNSIGFGHIRVGYTLINGLIFGLVGALAHGGFACVSHLALRIVLWRSGATPWKYARFLDYCADRIFLRKVGGGYIFIHRMLMEYFAELDISERQMDKAKVTDEYR